MGSHGSGPPPSVSELAAPVKSAVDKFQLLPAFLKCRGLVKQHIDSYNHFIEEDMKKIMEANSLLKGPEGSDIFLRYTNIRVERPTLEMDFSGEKLTPHVCRITDHTYAGAIKVDFEYSNGKHMGNQIEKKKDVVIGRLPIMLRSSRCHLSDCDEAELYKLGECPLDPGGYFIVKGTEKVILMQEQLSKNRIIIDKDNKGRVMASVTSSTHETKTKTVLYMDKERIYLQLNSFTKPIPVIVLLKAMGMTSDQEIVQMVGRDPRYGDLLYPSIQECVSEKIYTQPQALTYLNSRVKFYGQQQSSEHTNDLDSRTKSVLANIFLAHVPIIEGNFRPKCIYTFVMLRRMLDAILNADTFDDKDYVGNKRLELSGQLVSILFEDAFKGMNEAILVAVRTAYLRPNPSSRLDITEHIRNFRTRITVQLEKAISTGNWDISRFKMHKKGVSQVLSRLSYIGAFGQMTRISPQFEKSRKVSGPRALQPSQWGMLCPCDTPEGEACGLTKNLALMTHVTTDLDEGPIIKLCFSLGVQDLLLLSGEELHAPGSYLVMFNGLILGKHTQPQLFANSMRKLRRSGKLGEFVSIFVNEKQQCIYVASDSGRVCRPLVIADKGISRVKQHHMKELQDGVRAFDDFLKDGLIEYLDVNEENNALIALYDHGDSTSESGMSNCITHFEIEPLTLLGVVAGLIPFPHHNQSPRNTYQCAMGKQAMGNIAYNQFRRADTLLYTLVYAQRPLLTTRTIELVGYDKLGAGQNATVAVMSFSGYDIEDAIVMNKASLDRGFGRCIAMKKITVHKESYEGGAEDRIVPPQRDRNGFVDSRMQILDSDGIASPGQIVRNNNILVSKQSPLKDRDYKDTFSVHRGTPEGETTVIDRVILCSDSNKLGIKLIIRHTRRPELGDKFSSRHGQKGVCGKIELQENFPFSELGICPDLIMNPHGFPSRMTIGKMIELLGSKAGVLCGRFHYGSAFGEPGGHADKVEDISSTLIMHGFSYSGKDFLYSGISGQPLQAYIFMGPIYYQKLKHMVIDKMHARARGPRVLLTRQPTEGRSHQGGLRLGEMERDCLIAHGPSNLLHERLFVSSDSYEIPVCRKCGLFGYYNFKLKNSYCSMCKSCDGLAQLKLPYACKLLIQEMHSMNVVCRLKLEEAT